MTAGIILVISILVLGGVIATVSDRLGTKVGKARLSLFNLRPRNTAMVVTIVTGSVLSALTLGILFASSKPLRRGVFQIDKIQTRLNDARKDLTRAEDERKRVETDLAKARVELKTAMDQLNAINQSLQTAQSEAFKTAEELQKTQSRLGELQKQLQGIQSEKTAMEDELARTENRLQQVFQQKQSLQTEISQLRTERQNLIQQREQVKAQIKTRDREIAKRAQEMKQQDQEIEQQEKRITEQDKIIAKRESRLQELEIEQEKLEQQKQILANQVELVERDFQLLREGSVVLERGEVLASGLVHITDPKTALQAINTLLQKANDNAIEVVQLGNTKANQAQVIQITKAEVEELMDQIDDGRDYVVQIISAANFLVGETRVAVFTKAEPNRLLFTTGEIIAGTTFNPSTLSNEQLRKQLQQLLDASSFRARFVGVVDGTVQIGNDRMDTLIRFFQQLQEHNQPLEIQAVAAEDAYTIGPLRLDLLARRNGEVIFSTRQQEPLNDIPQFPNPFNPEPNKLENSTSQSYSIQQDKQSHDFRF
ncbi:DUF3084 domain-containing protein [Planktothrix mougeotii]|uniref:DUF3084 domain-containing protein n=1 Tax=Planktothrix mougeotii LEGE 06226 TaxID=1828728 RepID=A0ABR9UJJ2_9CYAN|nr:DUF3084 domain-containing protein [Planktothrix mougeotii]MBE9146634.1 DUF3084 domain-containing protein [Planktothrix mougeotii LEGE 06226]